VAGPNPVVGAAISSVSDISRRTAAPGALMTLFGSNLSRLKGNLDGFRGLDTLPKSLNGTSVTIGGAAASLLLVAPQQIVLQVPAEATAGNQPLVVTSSTGASAALSVPVTATAPNIFFDAAGGLIVRNNDFQLVRGSNAAAAGDILVIYSTGSGATSAALPTGKLAGVSPLSSVSGTTAVTVGGVPATVLYSIAAPGFAGLNQTAIRMPSGVPAGTAQVVMTVGGVTSNSVALATR